MPRTADPSDTPSTSNDYAKAIDLAKQLVQNDQLLTVKEAAAYLRLRPHLLDCWRSLGVGPPYSRFPIRRIRYRLSDLNAYVLACQERTYQPKMMRYTKPRGRETIAKVASAA